MADPVYEPLILTQALAAQWVTEEGPDITADIAMDDLIHGRTVVIRKLTEAQARDMAEGHFTFMMPNEKRCNVNGWLACARALGAIVEDGK